MSEEIRTYAYDDESLILALRHYFGSEQHYHEHQKHFYRSPKKTFFIGFIDSAVAGYCSLSKGEIQDLHTVPCFRNRGIATSLIRYIQARETVLTLGTSNTIVESIAKKLGFIYYLSRGKYNYFRWEAKGDH